MIKMSKITFYLLRKYSFDLSGFYLFFMFLEVFQNIEKKKFHFKIISVTILNELSS